MNTTLSASTLAQQLIRRNTVSGGDELQALEIIAAQLAQAGFTLSFDHYDAARPQRCSMTARLHPSCGGPALLLCGHIDTVPVGVAAWKDSPFSGAIRDGELHGRGSCDMKSGIAAMVTAAIRMAPRLRHQDIVLHIYGGEETGCEGSFHLAALPESLRHVGAAIVGEPTACRPLAGHKGALWLTLNARGVTAHASMPERGENALAKLLPAATALLDFHPEAEHPWLGKATYVLSTLHAGMNSNSVPDSAALTLDIRTVPAQNHAELTAAVAALAGPQVQVKTTLDLPPVWTEPDSAWSVRVRDVLAPFLEVPPAVETVQFFTDAAALRKSLPDLPVLILGPGYPARAHQTDEACPVAQIELAADMYAALIADWYQC